jgi:hypothetical protein
MCHTSCNYSLWISAAVLLTAMRNLLRGSDPHVEVFDISVKHVAGGLASLCVDMKNQ